MHEKAKAARDIFAFSRGGLTVLAPYVAASVVAGDRINQARDEHIRRARAVQNDRVDDCPPDAAGTPQTA